MATADFNRWRRTRPFLGGLLLILSGVEMLLSGNMQLGALEVKFGPEGFQSYVIPAVMLLCGLLTWFTPAQRLFYGILGTLVAVYSLIGVNLGGFLLGLFLGVAGGALTVAWTPVELDEPAPAPAAAPAQEPEEYGGLLFDRLGDTGEQPLVPAPAPYDERNAAWFSEPPSGSGGAGWAESERPPAGPHAAERRRLRFPALGLVVLLAVTAGVVPVPGTRPALAAPTSCPPGGIDAAAAAAAIAGSPSGSKRPATRSSAPASKAPAPPVAKAPPAGSPPASPSGGAAGGPATGGGDGDGDEGGGGFFGWLGRLFGGGKRKADPSEPPASGTPAPPVTTSARPGAASSASGKPTTPGAGSPSTSRSASRTPSPSPSCLTAGPARVVPPGQGQPRVNERPSQMLADRLTQSGLSFDGVTELPTRSGTLRALKFTLRRSVATNFELRVPIGPLTKSLRTPELIVDGNVSFYATRFSGKLFGLIPITFTPDAPPPLILPELLFTSVDIQLAFVRADVLESPGLVVRYLPVAT